MGGKGSNGLVVEKGLNKYEAMFLLDTSRSAKDWDKVVGHVQDILKKNGAEILSCEKWGERKLAYGIGHHKRAVYLLVLFLCPGPAIGRIKRACQISDVIVRVLITVFDEKAKIAVEPEEPATAATPASAGAPAPAEGAAGDAEESEGDEASEDAGPPAKEGDKEQG